MDNNGSQLQPYVLCLGVGVSGVGLTSRHVLCAEYENGSPVMIDGELVLLSRGGISFEGKIAG